MPVDHISVGSAAAVVYAGFGTSLTNVAIGHVYCLWEESWAMECIVLSGFICFSFYKIYAVIPYL